jgi:oligopeptidase B
VDEYRWLHDRADPAVLAYLEAENSYTAESLRHTESLQEALYRELLGRIRESDLSVPQHDRGWWYYTRTEAGLEYPLYCRRPGTLEAPETIYLDQNALAEGHAYHALGGMDVSPDGRLLLYLEDFTARREYTLSVKDLATGAIVDRIAGVWNGTAWAEDNRTFFYTTADSAGRGDTVWRHVLGTPPTADARVFHEADVRNTVTLSRSRSGRCVFISTDSFTSSEWYWIPTDDPAAAPRLIAPRRPGVEYTVAHVEGGFLILTNDGARITRKLRAPRRRTPAPSGGPTGCPTGRTSSWKASRPSGASWWWSNVPGGCTA